MEPKMIWANLVSKDLDRTTKFYTALDFKANCIPTDELTSFIFGKDKFVINFFTQERFESSAKSEAANLEKQNEIIFSLSAESKEEVDQWYLKVKKAGAKIYSEPEKFEKGYTFGFEDPDGHKFNVLYWPGM
ncbi:glyoxalase/bleomycin resistance protein/dioxygenase [Flavobacterium limnosediminis JC2902]|uniref:Glyoxalase/bleomycin resistance protein/dioxygenase n=1 Tax=Flavobacterium limnosediminis JC2902 TaxID=1341181 RepID=V6SL06_9FLAO|nr:VOC family protein [Flavobacterium limnosediminis]ESU27129.1 glyoxalase/bleomycin resistance protein/dioxygenase [Flavobacterium limnosediminis JC2902]